MFQRSKVRVPALYTEWTFSHLFVVKIVVCVCKRGRAWPFCENNNEIVLITVDKGINKSGLSLRYR